MSNNIINFERTTKSIEGYEWLLTKSYMYGVGFLDEPYKATDQRWISIVLYSVKLFDGSDFDGKLAHYHHALMIDGHMLMVGTLQDCVDAHTEWVQQFIDDGYTVHKEAGIVSE
jgi:hypothetical protein